MGEFSEIYYALIFFFLALLQDEIKGVISSILCFLMIAFSKEFIRAGNEIGFTFFETVLAYDFIFFTIGIFLIGSKAGSFLIWISVISFLFNTLVWIAYTDYKNIVDSYYGIANIILFEILLYGHFTSTRVYPYIKSKFVKLEKCISEKLRSQHNNTAR